MLRRFVAAALLLAALGGLAVADDYVCIITEIADSGVTIETRKSKDKELETIKLAFSDKIEYVKKGKTAETKTTLAALKRRLAASPNRRRSIAATVTTEKGGKVVKVSIAAGTLPEKAASILAMADQIELYSLEPEQKAEKDKAFRGFAILGKAVLKDAAKRSAFVEELDEATAAGQMAKCFEPRHGVRATFGTSRVDVVVCFECGQAYVYYNDMDRKTETVVVNAGSQPAFDKILTDAKVPLAKQAKE